LVGWERHEHDSELLADGISLREDLHDLPWSRIGGNVVVGGLAAEEKIADASSSEVALVASLAQSANDFDGVLFWTRHQLETIRDDKRHRSLKSRSRKLAK